MVTTHCPQESLTNNMHQVCINCYCNVVIVYKICLFIYSAFLSIIHSTQMFIHCIADFFIVHSVQHLVLPVAGLCVIIGLHPRKGRPFKYNCSS